MIARATTLACVLLVLPALAGAQDTEHDAHAMHGTGEIGRAHGLNSSH